MKVLGIAGNPRRGGNTHELVKYAVDRIRSAGFDTEILELAGRSIQPCSACDTCQKTKRCSIEDDL